MQFIYNENKEVIVEKTDENLKRLIRGSDLWASECAHEKTWYHYASDEQGSIIFIADEKEIKNRYEYDAFGNAVICEEQVENRYKYTGQQYDQITQQYYLRARYYNPVIARFTQEDVYRGDGLNLYACCDNNPVKYYDPSGYCGESKDPLKALRRERYLEYRRNNPNMTAQEAHWRAEVDCHNGNLNDAARAKSDRIIDAHRQSPGEPVTYTGPQRGNYGGGSERPSVVSVMVDTRTGATGLGYAGSDIAFKGTPDQRYKNPTKNDLTPSVESAVERTRQDALATEIREGNRRRSDSFTRNDVDNCAEVNAANNLQRKLGNDNIFDRPGDIMVTTRNNMPKKPGYGEIMNPCDNCQRTFDGFTFVQ